MSQNQPKDGASFGACRSAGTAYETNGGGIKDANGRSLGDSRGVPLVKDTDGTIRPKDRSHRFGNR